MISTNISSNTIGQGHASPLRNKTGWDKWEPWLYLLALGFSEMVSDIWAPAIGIWLHAILAAWLMIRGGHQLQTPRGKFYIAISTMALIRIISFAISPTIAPGVWYYTFAEIPLMLFAAIGTRSLDLPWLKTLGAVWPKGWLGWSILAVLSGPLIGWGEGHILHPAALSANGSLSAMILPAILLTAFTGFSEEWLFRGLIQTTASQWMGPTAGLFFTAFGWSLLHIGWNSAPDVVYVCLVGLFWCWIRTKTESTWATGIAHGTANIVLFCVLPWHTNLYFIPTLWH